MLARIYNQTPPVLLVLAAFVSLTLLLSRETSVTEDIPAFLPLNDNSFHVELTGTAVSPGVYQINDAFALSGVISLTGESALEDMLRACAADETLQAGERLEFIRKGRNIEIFRRGWMSASHRVSLGIALHPDRMSFEDWQFLPGIGVSMAEKIVRDRQENGDYLRLEGLLRVRGIGLKSIEKWRVFFSAV